MCSANLIEEALEKAKEIDQSMQVVSCGYDGIVNKIEIKFVGEKNGVKILRSQYLNVPCNSTEEAKRFETDHAEYFI